MTFTPLSGTVGKRLEILRAEFGIKSAAAAARRYNLSRTRWDNWEKGLALPHIPTMLQVCDETGVTLDWLFRGRPEGMPPELGLRLKTREREAGISQGAD